MYFPLPSGSLSKHLKYAFDIGDLRKFAVPNPAKTTDTGNSGATCFPR
jgi:hypothetical protein